MKTVSLSGSPRENVGKKDARDLRRADQVPCVVYGGNEQIHFSADHLALSRVVVSPDVYVVHIDLNGRKVAGVIKEVQFHPVTDRILHVDFQEVVEGKPLKMEIPVRVTGQAIGVRQGGKLSINFRRLMVRGMADDMPEAVEIDITKLRVGDNIRIKNLELKGLTILQNPEAVIVAVKRGRAAISADEPAEEETEEAAPAEAAE